MLAADKGESKDYSAAITVELLRFLKPLNATESNCVFRSEMGKPLDARLGASAIGTKHQELRKSDRGSSNQHGIATSQ